MNADLNTSVESNESVQANDEILNFLEYTISLISEAKSAEDVDLLMDDFIASDMTSLLTEHQYLFRVLSVVWLNSFKRVFIQGEEKSFPVNVLWLPILFAKLGWELKDKNHLESLFQICLSKAEESQSLHDYLSLLFIDGLLYSCDEAFQRFTSFIALIEVNDLEKQKIETLMNEIRSLGW